MALSWSLSTKSVLRFTAYKESSEKADTLALYAEYAIDFAVLSMKHALLAAFSAIEMQMSAEETEQKNDKQL